MHRAFFDSLAEHAILWVCLGLLALAASNILLFLVQEIARWRADRHTDRAIKKWLAEIDAKRYRSEPDAQQGREQAMNRLRLVAEELLLLVVTVGVFLYRELTHNKES